MHVRTKRIYENFDPADGRRILVDRLWPRGVAKSNAQIDFWARSVSPSNELRRWYGHDPEKWGAFRERYFAELDSNPDGVSELRSHLGSGTATLLYGSKETRLNNASALRITSNPANSGVAPIVLVMRPVGLVYSPLLFRGGRRGLGISGGGQGLGQRYREHHPVALHGIQEAQRCRPANS